MQSVALMKALMKRTLRKGLVSMRKGLMRKSSEHDGADGQQHAPRKARRPRPPTKWPIDKMMVTKIDEGGMPRDRKQKLRLWRLCGLIVRQRLPLVMPRFNCLKLEQKCSLFEEYVMPWLHFQDGMKELVFKRVMKTTAKSWRTHRSNLVRKYIAKGLDPFSKHPYIEPEDWEEFVQFKKTEEAQAERERFKKLRDLNVHNHNMGPIGYDGKKEQWEREDSDLTSQGILNPWDEYPPGRPRSWLRGRSSLEVSEGKAQIKWKKDRTASVSKEMKEKQAQAETLGINFERENDLLTACLGPEQPGRVRGVSSSMGWKYAWPECSGMYRKRKRNSLVDMEAIKDQIRAEVTRDVLSMLSAQGIQLQPFSRNPSPAPVGRRSSCASASDAAEINADVLRATAEHSSDPEKLQMAPYMDPEPDSIDLLSEPTPCSLIAIDDGYRVEVARGLVYPQQTTLHSVPILAGYAVVKVEMVVNKYEGMELDPPPNDETSKLGGALLQRVQWRRTHILVNPPPMDEPREPHPPRKDSTKSPLAAKSDVPPNEPAAAPTKSDTLLPRKKPTAAPTKSDTLLPQQKPAAAPTNSAPTLPSKESTGASKKRKFTTFIASGAAKKSKPPKDAAAEKQQTAAKSTQEQEPAKGSQKKQIAKLPLKDAAAAEKPADNSAQEQQPSNSSKVASNSMQKAAGDLPQQSQQHVIGSQNASSDCSAAVIKVPKKAVTVRAPKKQPKKDGRTAWTKANPKFKQGQPMLTDAELESAGPATSTLHRYYLQKSKARQNDGLVVKFKRIHLLRSLDVECFLVGFNDLYDLFNIDALDISLLRCFTLCMVRATKMKSLPVGFLDPEVMSLSTIRADKSYVLDYLAKAFKIFHKKECIMFAHNTIGHWILVAVIPKWGKLFYFDSIRAQAREHASLKEVINEAKGLDKKTLVHATKFPCHQQPPGNACGFYAANHMMEALRTLDLDDPKGFEVLSMPLGKDELCRI
ncbi:unnamed protein product [Urochloa decumbens]|uniref:DUF8039 domain-containing protein n=1 Tax=Urochloa decumbens TaxID=240449 RepID=A0ABC8WCL9_9POAL